jgi:Na+/phosphate symporter
VEKHLEHNPMTKTTSEGQYTHPPLDLSIAKPEQFSAVSALRALWERVNLVKIVLFVLSLFLFILAITLMKTGARGLAPIVRDTFSVTNPANSLGFGWLFSYIIMSGSPVAAAALTFFDAGMIDKFSTYTMIAGSRLGASFIVLLIGFLYVLRGRDKSTSLSMGLLSLTVTATTYIPGLILGAIILKTGVLDEIQPGSSKLLTSFVDQVFEPIARFLANFLPDWTVFLVGLSFILISFNLFDKCLPQMAIKESKVGQISQIVYRPVVMFMLGALITLVSMSVSLSLSILVPLSNRGFVRRENVIPYIMGANITTFIDTLLAALLLDSPPAFTVVYVEMVSTAIISIVILATCYKHYQKDILKFLFWATSRNRNLVIFMVIIFSVPIILMFL